MNRLTEKMAKLKRHAKKAFIAYIMAGRPTWDSTIEIILELEKAGITAVELGVPFSDPIADGTVIQAAANRALDAGVTLDSIFDHVALVRQKSNLPILLMGYWNVFLKHGKNQTIRDAKNSGIDGFIVADLPYEADLDFFQAAERDDICTVLLAAELTSEERLKTIAEKSTGFLYYVPKLGVTGLDLSVTAAMKTRISRIKAITDQPVCIGLGIKTRNDVIMLDEVADGVIVGTRIVRFIEEYGLRNGIASATAGLVRQIMP